MVSAHSTKVEFDPRGIRAMENLTEAIRENTRVRLEAGSKTPVTTQTEFTQTSETLDKVYSGLAEAFRSASETPDPEMFLIEAVGNIFYPGKPNIFLFVERG